MADFTRIKEQDLWLNLDYVVRIEPNADEAGSTAVIFADGTSFTISNADGNRLLKRLRPQKKKKKKKKAAPEIAAPDAATPDAAAPETAAPEPDVVDDQPGSSGDSGF